ncbi:MAG: OsmC family protein [Nitrospirota bacterium]
MAIEANVTLVEGMEFKGTASSGHTLTLDANHQYGGRNSGFRAMELVLIGLAGCTGMDVISILRKKKQGVVGFEVNVKGERAEEHPMVYKKIDVEYVIKGRDISEEAVARSISLSWDKYCSVGAMLKKTADMNYTYKIIEIR